MAKNPFNQRNPRYAIFSLFPFPLSLFSPHLTRPLYICRETFTNVMSALQNKLFMQNKAKFRKVKLDVNNVLTKDYDKMDTWSIGKKQSQTNPNKAKLKKAKMNVSKLLTKDYENKPPIRAPKKQSQTSKRQKTMQTLLPQRIMKKPPLRAPKKQTQTNPMLARHQCGGSKAKMLLSTFLLWILVPRLLCYLRVYPENVV
jgi:hypothetical protein